MTGSVALVLVSAFLHAGWNALVRREPVVRAGTVVLMLISVVGALAAAAGRGAPLLHGPALLWTLGSACAEAVYVVGLARSLELAPLGLAYSVSRGTGLLLVWPVAVAFQHEAVTAFGAVASALVLAGVLAAGSKPGELKLGPGAGWALIAGLGSGVSNPCIRQALVHGAEPLQVFAVGLGLGLIPAIATLGVAPPALVRIALERWKTLLPAGLLCFGSYALFLVALQAEGAAFGTTLRNASIAFALVLAWATGQKPTPRQWAGGTAVMAGASLLALKL